MRSKIEANEYKDYILGFIFYKFLSDKAHTANASARNGGMIRGKGKDGFLGGTILGPLKGYTTRNGITRSILDDMNLIGGN